METLRMIMPDKVGEHYLLGRNINKRYSNGFRALEDVAFFVEKGKCLGLVGESGSGKSTLARCILMLEKISDGEIWLDGTSLHDYNRASIKGKRKKMQAVFQDPNSALNSKIKVVDSLMEPLDHQKGHIPDFLSHLGGDRRKIGKYLLELMELPERYLDMYPHELSGGQKQRITIARAISVNPELIILDEPTASLDVSVQAKVLNLLKDLQEEFGLTYLFISHDLSAVNFMSHNVMVLYKGKVVDAFEKNSIFSGERHPYTQQLLKIFEDRM